jgi:hypothetical protein
LTEQLAHIADCAHLLCIFADAGIERDISYRLESPLSVAYRKKPAGTITRVICKLIDASEN